MTSAEETAPAIDKNDEANRIIRTCSLVSIGAGVLPFPIIDLVALGGMQVYLVRELCKIYEIPFSKQRVKGVLSAVAGGVAPAVAFPIAVSVAKAIPIIGQLAAVATMPALTAASTLAVGRIFKRHFEAGGGLDDMDVESMKTEYADEVEKAKAGSAKAGSKKTAAAAA